MTIKVFVMGRSQLCRRAPHFPLNNKHIHKYIIHKHIFSRKHGESEVSPRNVKRVQKSGFDLKLCFPLPPSHPKAALIRRSHCPQPISIWLMAKCFAAVRSLRPDPQQRMPHSSSVGSCQQVGTRWHSAFVHSLAPWQERGGNGGHGALMRELKWNAS